MKEKMGMSEDEGGRDVTRRTRELRMIFGRRPSRARKKLGRAVRSAFSASALPWQGVRSERAENQPQSFFRVQGDRFEPWK